MNKLTLKERLTITERFQNLDEGKQKRILNAALREFAEKGYAQASTNRIVKDAGIGKGMLFYYFKNKRELYQYLVDYSVEMIRCDFISQIDMDEPDFIERLRQVAHIKMKALIEHPNVFNFMGTLLLTQELELPADLETRIEVLQEEGYAKLYDRIDTTLFRDDVDVEKAFQLIRWSIEGYQHDLENRLKGQKMTAIDFDSYWEEFYEYMDVLKTIFYGKAGDVT